MNKFLIGISLAALGTASIALARGPGPDMDPFGGKTVTRAEVQAKAVEDFAALDANKDGKLDQADRAEHRQERMNEKFAKLDTDKNGSISREEFAAAHADGHAGMRGHGEGKGEGKGMGEHRGMAGHEGMAMMMLHRADTNNDGAVSRDEFVAGHLAMFDKADTNKDGKVTPEERKAAHAMMRKHMKGMRHGGPDMPPPPGK